MYLVIPVKFRSFFYFFPGINFFQVLAFFSRYCALFEFLTAEYLAKKANTWKLTKSVEYLEKVEKILQVFSRYFPGIAHLWFSFQVFAFFFPGIAHFFF